MKPTGLSLSLSFALALPALAQEVIGSALIEDNMALIYSDGTWKYSADVGPVCRTVEPLFSVCIEPELWSPAALPGDKEGDLAFRNGNIFQARVSAWKTAERYEDMTEQERAKALIFGVIPRMAPEEFEKALQEQLRDTRGLLPTLAGRYDAEIDLEQARTVIMSGSPFGTRAVTYRFADDLSIIVETTEMSTLFTDEHKELHARLLAGITLGAEQ